jgi:osmoprotectant transport system permease protein
MRRCAAAAMLLLAAALARGADDAGATLKVGSKRFTESYILGEIAAQTARSSGAAATHAQGLGNTAIVLNALSSGAIDVYPEYTGTIAKEILKLDAVPPLARLNEALAPLGLAAGVPLGFNNTYALALTQDLAREKHIATLSDLAAHAELRLGLTQEFLGRADGWPGLKRAYALPFATPRGLDHGVAYEALRGGQVDVIDIYSTDAKIGPYRLQVLRDDRGYFPRYDAVLLYRANLPQRLPRAWAALQRLEGRIDDAQMQRLNAAAELQGQPFTAIAAGFVAQQSNRTPDQAPGAAAPAQPAPASATLWSRLFDADFARLAREHLLLVLASLAASLLIGLPLGVFAARHPQLGRAVLAAVGVLQTVPSIALLAFLIPLTGRIGAVPALIALTLYALLPIVRNAHAGLAQVPRGLRDAARSLGLSRRDTLRRIELPLAARTLWAGVKTSAVINVGTATIAAFIGAGGFGERIVTGLALNDHRMLLAGAIPAAALALLIEAAFDLAERLVVPRGLRLAAASGR